MNSQSPSDPFHAVSQTLLKLKVVHLEFTLRAIQPVSWKGNLNSMIRGMFGWNLKELSCVRACDDAHLRDKKRKVKDCKVAHCSYARSFLGYGWPKDSIRVYPPPYRIHAPFRGPSELTLIHAGEHFRFGLTLFGKGIEDAPFWILSALRGVALELGAYKNSFRLESVCQPQTDELLWHEHLGGFPSLPTPLVLRDLIPPPPENLHECTSLLLTFETPWIQNAGVLAKAKFPKKSDPSSLSNHQADGEQAEEEEAFEDFDELEGMDHLPPLEEFCRAILRRAHALFYRFEYPYTFHLALEEIQNRTQSIAFGMLFPYEQTRKSSSHRIPIPFKGFIGEIQYSGISDPYWVWDLMCLGTVVGVGSQTMMGFGEISFEMSAF